jgi:hypothetical protein
MIAERSSQCGMMPLHIAGRSSQCGTTVFQDVIMTGKLNIRRKLKYIG